MSVLTEVADERRRQDEKWGGPAHDDGHGVDEFVQFIEDYAGWARQMASLGSPEKARRRLIQVAALAVAAVESLDRRTNRPAPVERYAPPPPIVEMIGRLSSATVEFVPRILIRGETDSHLCCVELEQRDGSSVRLVDLSVETALRLDDLFRANADVRIAVGAAR